MTPKPPTVRDRGVTAVEMAIVLPLLIILVLGIVEAAWALSQQNAVRGLAREAARVAATHPDLDTAGIAAMVCGDDLASDGSLDTAGDGAFAYPGAVGFVDVAMPYDPITGFLPGFNGLTIGSNVQFAVEVPPDGGGAPQWWGPSGAGEPC